MGYLCVDVTVTRRHGHATTAAGVFHVFVIRFGNYILFYIILILPKVHWDNVGLYTTFMGSLPTWGINLIFCYFLTTSKRSAALTSIIQHTLDNWVVDLSISSFCLLCYTWTQCQAKKKTKKPALINRNYWQSRNTWRLKFKRAKVQIEIFDSICQEMFKNK